MDEYTLQIILLFPTQINGRAYEQLHIKFHLLVETALIAQTAVLLLHTDHIAVYHHAVLIVCQTLVGIVGYVEQDGEVIMSVQSQTLIQFSAVNSHGS